MTSRTTTAKTFTTKAVAALLASALVLPSVTTAAEAGHRHGWRDNHGHYQNHHRPRWHKRKRHNNDAGAAVAAGVIGFAAGAILGSALSQPRQYIDPPRRVYGPPRAPAYGGGYGGPVTVDYSPRPWTPEWYRYCSAKFRSFEPETGLYTTYSGVRKLCQ
ncbi:BA14K family protein [Rhizobiales bacterium]|uniref:BA14K family protein n=1 Tax=Hongsoonwoonella zoysiae TaxID=2821844 RepID=UPI00155F894A|nr:BA14K family protein [Hongsoonwoonella zoysiae]NRG17809.1 BA14K family protein [Hongsoonwoonella zoysiae]